MASLRPRSASKLMALDGWTSLRFANYGAAFLETLREGVTLTAFEAEVESCIAEIAKTDRATCVACKQKIPANLKLLVKLAESPRGRDRRSFDRSLHLGCGSALLRLRPDAIVTPPYLSDRQRAIVQGFFLARTCCQCMFVNLPDAATCGQCAKEMD